MHLAMVTPSATPPLAPLWPPRRRRSRRAKLKGSAATTMRPRLLRLLHFRRLHFRHSCKRSRHLLGGRNCLSISNTTCGLRLQRRLPANLLPPQLLHVVEAALRRPSPSSSPSSQQHHGSGCFARHALGHASFPEHSWVYQNVGVKKLHGQSAAQRRRALGKRISGRLKPCRFTAAPILHRPVHTPWLQEG